MRLSRILVSLIINGVALAAAAYMLPGIDIVGEPVWGTLAAMALIFGVVNALIRPLLKLLTCPLIILTLGLFILVINGLMLWVASWIGGRFGVGFRVAGFWSALLGALVVSVVSFFLTLLLRDNGRRERL